MKLFRDWLLRYKLIATSALLVVGVTTAMWLSFEFNLRQLRRQAIPDQRLILTLQACSYDYLSEIREYVLTSEAETIEEMAEISDEMFALLDDYELLHGDRNENPLSRKIATALRQGVDRLQGIGRSVVEFEDRIHQAVDEAEMAERALVAGSSSGDILLAATDFLSEVRQYLLDPDEETLRKIEELRSEIAGEPGTAPSPAALAALLAAGELTLELRMKLEETLEGIEEAEASLGESLGQATELAEDEVATATRQLMIRVASTAMLGLLLAAIIAVWLADRIARPIEQLHEAAQRFAGGELETRAPVESRDELGQLCVSFNHLAAESERLVGELRDSVSQLRSSQAQLVQSGKLMAVGELAASVAHELNNPLSVVLTYSVLLREACDSLDEEQRQRLSTFPERLELVEASAKRCKTIIDGLLQFSRQDTTELAAVDVADVLRKTFDLIGSQLRRHQTRWQSELEPDLPAVRANANQLQQILTNLALNAMQAMPSGGDLKVTAHAAPSGDDASPDRCEITVSDSGVGIPPENLDRVFEPFFTTKENGQGTGLGLSIAYGILQSHDGRIAVESPPGQGTTFRIQLPLWDSSEPSS